MAFLEATRERSPAVTNSARRLCSARAASSANNDTSAAIRPLGGRAWHQPTASEDLLRGVRRERRTMVGFPFWRGRKEGAVPEGRAVADQGPEEGVSCAVGCVPGRFWSMRGSKRTGWLGFRKSGGEGHQIVCVEEKSQSGTLSKPENRQTRDGPQTPSSSSSVIGVFDRVSDESILYEVDDTTRGYEPWRFIPQDIFDVLLGIIPPSAKSVGSMRLVCRNWHSGVNNSVRSVAPSIDVPTFKSETSRFFSLFSKLSTCKINTSQRLDVSRIVRTFIPKIQGLQTLDLSQTSSQLSDRELEVLFSVPTIRRLIVPECSALTDKRLKTLATLKGSLKHLDVGFCKLITSEGLKHIGQLTCIETLSLDRCWRVTDDGFPALKNLIFLRKLTVKDCWKITNAGVAAIGELRSLTHLNLDHCFRLTDVGMSSIAQLTNLRHLNLTDCWNLTDDGISRLKGLINLTELNLEHCFRITDDSLEALAGLTNMLDFNLKDCWAITNNGIAHLKSWHHLTNLDIQHCYRVTDFGMDALRGMTRIERLNLKDCWGLTDHTLSVFETLPRLSIVSMEHCFKVSDEGLEYLHSLPEMMYLNLKDCWGITDVGAASLASLPSLAYLNIKNCFKLTEEGLECLRSKEQLHLLC